MSQVQPWLKAFSQAERAAPPRHLGTRHTATRFLREPGNTVVCHLVEGSASQRAILAVRERLMAMPDADRLIFTPPASLHMTLFQGVVETRRAAPFWPPEMPLDTPIDEMTAWSRERLAGFQGHGAFSVTTSHVTPNGLRLVGATPEDRRRLAAWRDGLAAVLGYRHPDHDSYEFHVTLSYSIAWLAEERLPAWQAALDECLALITREAPVLELRPPAFCAFEDMEWFEELLVLR